jgi:hypothetical protein
VASGATSAKEGKVFETSELIAYLPQEAPGLSRLGLALLVLLLVTVVGHALRRKRTI